MKVLSASERARGQTATLCVAAAEAVRSSSSLFFFFFYYGLYNEGEHSFDETPARAFASAAPCAARCNPKAVLPLAGFASTMCVCVCVCVCARLGVHALKYVC
uniref:Uncharacterized protein n=1 Tax=Trichogramma kaykai TaxID=54128 RepID=A0ABD2W092_9HYME